MQSQNPDFDLRVAKLATLLHRRMYAKRLSTMELCEKISAHPEQFEKIIQNRIRFEDIPKSIIRLTAEMYSISAASLLVKTGYLNYEDFTVTGEKDYNDIQDTLDLHLLAVENCMPPDFNEKKAD